MKKNLLIFSVILAICPNLAGAAVTVKKASTVSKQATSVTDSAGSLVPTVLGLVSTVQSLNAKVKELNAECIPSASEVSFVNDMVKEWAKTGASTADEAIKSLGMQRCDGSADGGYARYMELYAGDDDGGVICTDWFNEAGTVWHNFPKAAIATYCPDGAYECGASKKKTVSNMYNIFNLVNFAKEDYTKKEAETAAKILAKVEKCSDARLSAAKRAMWGEFLTTTISNVGQPTNTGAIMQSVGNISGSGLGGLSSISGIATQILNK
ncbi:hypothetical protein HDR61_03795 [bacterium]|nr:hypothetical protein [bacterium]